MNTFPEDLASLRVGFIGAGRLGQALAWSLSEAGLNVCSVASLIKSHAIDLAAKIPDCKVFNDGQDVIDSCDLIFVTTPDDAISSTAAALNWSAGKGAVHCSGVTEVSALESARTGGAFIGGFHPMQTFADPVTAKASLPGSTITIEAQEPLNSLLVALADRLKCRVNRLPEGMRGRYHAAAGYTSQFINALFAEAAALWKTWGATEEDAVRALMPLAHGTLASISTAGIANGMPGPISRGDVGSIEKHVKAIAPLGDEALEFYRVVCNSTIPLGKSKGSIDAEADAKLQKILARKSV